MYHRLNVFSITGNKTFCAKHDGTGRLRKLFFVPFRDFPTRSCFPLSFVCVYSGSFKCCVQGETDKAIVSYTRAAELAPKLAAPRVNLGAQLLQSGRLPEAEAVRSETAVETIKELLWGAGACFERRRGQSRQTGIKSSISNPGPQDEVSTWGV